LLHVEVTIDEHPGEESVARRVESTATHFSASSLGIF
jgi:hypothetical protein